MKKETIRGIIGIALSLMLIASLLGFAFNSLELVLSIYWLQLFVILYIHKLKSVKWYVSCISSLIAINIINSVGMIVLINHADGALQNQPNVLASIVITLAIAIIVIPAAISAIIIIIECLISIGIRVYKYKKNNHREQELS